MTKLAVSAAWLVTDAVGVNLIVKLMFGCLVIAAVGTSGTRHLRAHGAAPRLSLALPAILV